MGGDSLMGVHHIAGSWTEYYEAFIEADTPDIARQIMYQNLQNLSCTDSDADIHIDDEDCDELPDLTMDDYDPNGGMIA
jgi:hypothetical protein